MKVKLPLLIFFILTLSSVHAKSEQYRITLNIFSGFENPIMIIDHEEMGLILDTLSLSSSLQSQNVQADTLFPYNGMSIQFIENDGKIQTVALLKGGKFQTNLTSKSESNDVQYVSRTVELLILEMARSKDIINDYQFKVASDMIMNKAPTRKVLNENTTPITPRPNFFPEPPSSRK